MSGNNLARALEITAGIGSKNCNDDELFRLGFFRKNPKTCLILAANYKGVAKRKGYKVANLWLLRTDKKLQIGKTGKRAGLSDCELKELAEVQATKAREIVGDLVFCGSFNQVRDCWARVDAYCKEVGVNNPVSLDDDETKQASGWARLNCPRWWLRQLRVVNVRKLEAFAREMGLVSKQRGAYVSPFAMSIRLAQKTRNHNFMQDLVIENEAGFQAPLLDAVNSSVANPVNRCHELKVRGRGFEEIAKGLGYVCLFFTFTCPSKFHAVLESGYKNPHFEGATPRQAQDYLNGVWAKIRAAWKRANILPFGFRVAEPHHDATPHWHMCLFVPKSQAALAELIAFKYVTQCEAQELYAPRALGSRFDCKVIDPNEMRKNKAGEWVSNSPFAYLLKYITKNIAGATQGIEQDDESGDCAAKSARRVDAWAGCWGIRQFQQIGGASVTVWRELRRIVGANGEGLAGIDSGDIKAIAAAAHAGDWAAFVDAMGGATVPKGEHVIEAFKVVADVRGQYGDFVERIKGILMRRTAEFLETRLHTWVIKRAAQSAAPRTCDNNYTRGGVIGRGSGLKIPDKTKKPRFAAAG